MIEKQKADLINNLISKLCQFVEKDKLSQKFEAFVKDEIDEPINSKEKYLEVLYAFIFDQELIGARTPLQIFIDEADDLLDEEKDILEAWKGSIHSIFEVNKVTKESFSCYNMVNEQDYTIKTLTSYLNYKRVGIKNFIFCRILPYEDYHILLGNLITFPVRARREMLEMATMVQIENPSEMFKDNLEKLEQIYEKNSIKYQKFYDMFDSDEVYTTGDNLNQIIAAFTAYYEYGEMEKDRIEGLTEPPEEFYFDKEVAENLQAQKNVESYISNYANCHDVGIIMDKKEGLSILPYYKTFMEIFKSSNYEDIKNYKDCLWFYLEDESVSPFPFVKAITRYPVNSVKVFEELLDQPGFSIEEDFDELMNDYKYDYIFKNKLAVTSVYDNSLAFKELVGIYEDIQLNNVDMQAFETKVGRNDPCPCGSGKKFKKCCLIKLEM